MVNILKSIDEGPFQMGTTRGIVAEGTEGPINLGPERPRVYSDLSQDEKDRYNADIRATNIILQGSDRTEDKGNNARVLQQQRGRASSQGPALTQAFHRTQNTSKDNMLPKQAQENGVVIGTPVQDFSSHVEDNVFQADDYDAYDSDVDEAPTAQTMFMANLVCNEAGPSYDSDVLSEVHDHDHYQDVVCDHHEEHEMHDDVQPNHVVDSHADYTSDSNMTPYDQYVKDNVVPVVQNNASMIPNDAYVMIDNDVHESDVLSVSHTP
ncbi:hypothetical protein Tco_1389543 [Tanacetum coccineum]